MTYAQIDDRFDDHPKFTEYGPAEMGLIACGITYANRNLTDGRLPKSWPTRRFGLAIEPLVERLIVDGVWRRRTDGDLAIVGFLEHNPSREEVEERRRKKAEAGVKGGRASWQKRSSKHEADASTTAEAKAKQPMEQKNGPAEPISSPLLSDPRSPVVPTSETTHADREPDPRPASGPLPRSVVLFERNAWIAAYERAVDANRGEAEPWTFPGKAFGALVEVVQKHCVGDDRQAIDGWIGRDVADFVGAVLALNEDPRKLWAGYGPDGLQKWHNDGRPGLVRAAPRFTPPPPLPPPPMSAVDTARAAEQALEAMRGALRG